ncbi:peptidase domain-containing ABC transporter [Aeoliella sp. SH292]|uniref:peptidase domain-containing ABC transporter n=1 Tax=Aeoliella sp. SH292 TaxID=3454464 RepID=UPI003F991CB3
MAVEYTVTSETHTGELTRLAKTLVLAARSLGVESEIGRVRHLIYQTSELTPGEIQTHWSTWMEEVARNLHLRPRIANLTGEAAWQLCCGGASLVTPVSNGGQREWWALIPDQRGVMLDQGNGETTRVAHPEKLVELLGSNSDSSPLWVILTAPEIAPLHHEASEPIHPISRLLSILRPERQDVWTVTSFALFIGILSIASPIAVESLVNTVAFGSVVQPVIVLSTILFVFLGFLAAITGLQTYVVEILQRRLFTRVAADLSFRIPRAKTTALDDLYFPELVNRFFDVITLQKGTAYLLLDGITIILTTLVGMTVLAFYHPWFLGFDLLLLGLVVLGVYVLGRGALQNSLKESKYKYRLAAWFEEMARCNVAFRHAGATEFCADRASLLTGDYLDARETHFQLLFRQILFLLLLQAAAATITLGFGGWLVIQGQLTLGQLVAAELIVSAILVSLAKLGKHLEGFYDLLAGVDKLGRLLDLPIERQSGVLHLDSPGGAAIELTDVQCVLNGKSVFRVPLSAQIPPGSITAVVGSPGSGKSVLQDLLFALRDTSDGHIEVDGTDPADVSPDILRRRVALVRAGEIFAGSVSENIYLGRTNISHHELRAALAEAGLLDQALRLPQGLETPLGSNGHPLSATQQSQLLLARALVRSPKLLLIDGVLDGLGDNLLRQVFYQLRQRVDCTLVIATNSALVASHCDYRLDLDVGSFSSEPMKIADKGASR